MYTCEELLMLQERLIAKRNPNSALKPVYLRDEVCVHNRADDAWVIVNNRVIDITPFLAKPDVLMNPPLAELLAFAGKDLSHHFHEDNRPRTRITHLGNVIPTLAATAECTEYTGGKQPVPNNLAPDVYAAGPRRVYWWEPNSPWDIGRITSAERALRIINTMTMSRINMTVCEEDTIDDIRAKYNRRYNAHSGSYTWRKSYRNKPVVDVTARLDFTKTLTENGLLKETETSLPPAIWLSYNDDFTIA